MMDLRNSYRTNYSKASEKTFLSSTLSPLKFYLAIHGFYTYNKNVGFFLHLFLWLYRSLFFLFPLFALIRVTFYFPNVTFGFSINFILLLAIVVWCSQSVCGIIFMMYFSSKNKLEELENLWKKYKLDLLAPGESTSAVAYIPALYPISMWVINTFVIMMQGIGVIPSQNPDLGINFKAPYLLAIIALFSWFGWGSVQAIYIANVNLCNPES